MSEENWYPRQRVWSPRWGEGVVDRTADRPDGTMWVMFDVGFRHFLDSGKLSEDDEYPTLFAQPMELVPKPWPIEYEHDEVILVRDFSNSRWEPRCFARVCDGKVHTYHDGKSSMTSQFGGIRAWEHHRKYDENLAWKFEEEQ